MIKKTYNRILDISDDHKQITLPDSRYYRRNGEFYPSVTYVLNSYPKGKHFEDWLKKVGYSADWIVKKSGEEGNAVHLFSDELKIAGTCDCICEIDGELWVIDFKTSNHLHTTYDLQCAAYAQMYKECFGQTADRIGVLWLKSKSRGVDRTGFRVKGKKWEMHESPRTQEENLEIFKSVKRIFDIENPKHKPATTSFKTTVKRTT